MIKISASIACANFANLAKDIEQLGEAGIDLLHFDVADGNFADTFLMGPSIINQLRPLTTIPFDTHLAVYEPSRFIEQFVRAGSNFVTIHVEACPRPEEVLLQIRDLGAKPAIALRPETPATELNDEMLSLAKMVLVLTVHPGYAGQKFIASTLAKIKNLHGFIKKKGYETEIEVDGAINLNTVTEVVRAGARVLVGGSSGILVKEKTIGEAVKALREKSLAILAKMKQ